MKVRRTRTLVVAAFCGWLGVAVSSAVQAEEPAADAAAKPAAAAADKDALAKASQNPVASMISVPFENNFYFNAGPLDKHANALNIKPVIPLKLGENWNLINRAIIPVIWEESGSISLPLQIDLTTSITTGRSVPSTGSEWGLGNITYEGFISPAKPGKIIWGIGPAFQFPTNTGDRFGPDVFSGGVAAVALAMPGHFVLGGLVQQINSIASAGGQPRVNSFLFQYFINYNMKDGWYLNMAPNLTANWEEPGGDVWTVPVGGGFGKIFHLGKQAMDVRLNTYYNVARPTNSPDWNAQLTVKLLFPKK